MAAIKPRIELKVPVRNQPGQLTDILRIVSKAGVNLLAFCGYSTGPETAEVLLVPDHEGKARKALEGSGYKVQTSSVIAIQAPAGTGAGAKLADKLSSRRINLKYAYASSAPDGRSTAIFCVDDADMDPAIKALS